MQVLDSFAAEDDWKRARRKLLYQKVVCSIRECSADLLSFEDARAALHLRQKFNRGLQEIPLDQIRGSVGRFDDFAAGFLPRKEYLRERWQNVDVAMRQGKMPPIEVYQVGETYYVLDGNHRVSIARQYGVDTIEAYVWEYPVPTDLGSDAEIDDLMIDAERMAFLEKTGETNAAAASSLRFTCSGCYNEVSNQVEIYRQDYQKIHDTPISFEQAFARWYDEVYVPAIDAVRENDLLSMFPGRTDADLFIWACQNSSILEDLEGDETQ